MLAIVPLSPAVASPYASFTYRKFRPWLLDERHPDAPRLIALGVRRGEEPVGLVVAGIAADGDDATLCSIFVKERHRQSGVGAYLLGALEAACRARDLPRLATRFHATGDMTGLHRLLARGGWATPRLISRYHRFALQPLLGARWLTREHASARYRMVPWAQVAPGDWEDAERALEHETDNPEYFQPRRLAEVLVPACSFALFEEDRLVGWSLVDQEIPGTLYYRSLFIRPSYRNKGLGIALAATTARGALDTGATHGVLQVLEENLEMRKILQRLVLPLQPQITDYLETERILSPQ